MDHYRNNVKNSLDYVRVERRCARSKGIWIEDKGLCKLTKVVGNILKNFGFQDKSGIYLLPEETLFLIEQNKLELTYNTKQVSIYDVYKIVFNHITLQKYKVYKNLVEKGFKLLNKEAIRKFYSGEKKCNGQESKYHKKRKKAEVTSEIELDCEVKRRRKDNECPNNFEVVQKNEEQNFDDLFEKLRKHGPKLVLPCESSKQPDYFGFLPTPGYKHNHEFNLYIREKIDLIDFENYEHIPNIYAIYTNDNVTFCRYPNVNIPIIN
ncbi:uncharacterized protein LOC123682249 isoform X2 [Harmonia axyridis]|nr:uncharacterized protein LOC123682249 isoform X2 [Harmonia axyridis]